MAEQKSSEERIAELDKRIEQIKAQKKLSSNVKNKLNVKQEPNDSLKSVVLLSPFLDDRFKMAICKNSSTS